MILLVEDSALGGRTVTRVLEREGLEVRWARTCAEARAVVAGVRPDVVIVDQGLPDGDGVRLAEDLKRSVGCRVVVLSGGRPRAGAPGVDVWLEKPVTNAELIGAVRV